MTSTSSPKDHAPGTRSDDPGDLPGERPPALDRLDALIGTWEMEARFEAGYFGQGSPAITGRGGRTTFDWLEGRFFVAQRLSTSIPPRPAASRSSVRARNRAPAASTTTTHAASPASTT